MFLTASTLTLLVRHLDFKKSYCGNFQRFLWRPLGTMLSLCSLQELYWLKKSREKILVVVVFSIGLLSVKWLTGAFSSQRVFQCTLSHGNIQSTWYCYCPFDNVTVVEMLSLWQNLFHMCSKCWHWCWRCMLRVQSRLHIWHCFHTCYSRCCGHEMAISRHWSDCFRPTSVAVFDRSRQTNWQALVSVFFWSSSYWFLSPLLFVYCLSFFYFIAPCILPLPPAFKLSVGWQACKGHVPAVPKVYFRGPSVTLSNSGKFSG